MKRAASWVALAFFCWVVASCFYAAGVEAERQRTIRRQFQNQQVLSWYRQVHRQRVAQFN